MPILADVHLLKINIQARSFVSVFLFIKHFNLSHQSLSIKIEYILLLHHFFVNILMKSL